MKFAPATFLALVLVAPAAGQAPPPRVYPEPDARGEVVISQPEYQGVRAAAPIPPQLHIRNEGGSDGAGLCVYASMVIAGAYQQAADLMGLKDSALWRYVKGRPGGSYPEKLIRDVQAVYGDGAKVTNYNGQDDTVMENLTEEKKPFGITFGQGRNYGNARIPHMVTGIHYSRKTGWACIVDNNFPGVYSWMPAVELKRRAMLLDNSLWVAWWSGSMPHDDDADPADGESPWVWVLVALVPALILYLSPKGQPGAATAGIRLAA